MIVNIPNPEAYFESAKELLNVSWEQICALSISFFEAEEQGLIYDREDTEKAYWRAALRSLLNSYSLIQQSHELILKGKICSISPYLLIFDNAYNFPKNIKKSMDFEDFRSIDAKDLIGFFELFSGTVLDKKFKDKFSKMRIDRNKIIHSSGNRVVKDHKDIINLLRDMVSTIISTYDLFFPGKHWIDERLFYIEKSPESSIYGNEYSRNILCREIYFIVKLLNPALVKRLFGLNKNIKKYLCPYCWSSAYKKWGLEEKLAELTENQDSVKCAVCRKISSVFHDTCPTINCNGHVFSSTERICLSCGRDG